jgi:Homeodomain-like domain
MIRGHFLSEEDRNKLIALARDGSVGSRVTRRANALVLLDDGWSCQEVAAALLLNDDTIRGWFKLFEQRGIEGLTSFDVKAPKEPPPLFIVNNNIVGYYYLPTEGDAQLLDSPPIGKDLVDFRWRGINVNSPIDGATWGERVSTGHGTGSMASGELGQSPGHTLSEIQVQIPFQRMKRNTG